MLKHFKRRVDHSSKTTPLEHLKHHDIPAWPSRSQARGWRNLAWRRWRFTPWRRRPLVRLKIIIALRIPPQIQRREVIDVVVWQCWRVLQGCPIEGKSLRVNANSNQTFNLHLDEGDLVTWLDAHEELWETSSWRLDDDMHFATDLALALALALTRRRARALACQALRMEIRLKVIKCWMNVIFCWLMLYVNAELIVEPHMGLGTWIILHGSLGFAHGLDPLNFQMVHGYLGLSGMDVAHGAACLIFNSLKKLANANKLRAEVPFPSYLQSFQLKTARSRNSSKS